MVSTRIRCVVTLTIFALATLCQTAKVVARASRGAEPQNHGLDTLPFTDLRRRWPARLLLSFSSTSVGERLKSSPLGKIFSRQKPSFHAANFHKKREIVERLFHTNKVKEVDAENMFKSSEFKKWSADVKAAVGRDSEKLMFQTLSKEFNKHDNGGIEALLVQAMKDKKTEALALRFENRLLDEWSEGLKEDKLEFIKKYMRYVLYRDPHQQSVHLNMQRKLGGGSMDNRIASYNIVINDNGGTPLQKLDHYFKMVSSDRKIGDVFKGTHSVKGFDNYAFLFEKLYKKATDPTINVNFPNFMLTTLRKAEWSDQEISAFYHQLKNQKFSPDFQKEVDPLIKAMT